MLPTLSSEQLKWFVIDLRFADEKLASVLGHLGEEKGFHLTPS